MLCRLQHGALEGFEADVAIGHGVITQEAWKNARLFIKLREDGKPGQVLCLSLTAVDNAAVNTHVIYEISDLPQPKEGQ